MTEKAKKWEKRKIVQCTLNGHFVKEWEGTAAPCTYYGFTRGALRFACQGKRKDLAGYRWFYKEEYVKNMQGTSL